MSARMEEKGEDGEGDTGESMEDSALDKPFAPPLPSGDGSSAFPTVNAKWLI